uniref:Uncharacterized protein n=1 Tax=Arundo donax TaxID=35708 RepID=A0A0A9CM31_ARUDO
MDGNGRSAPHQKKPIVTDDDLVELLWHKRERRRAALGAPAGGAL